MAELSQARTSVLDIAYEHSGPADGPVVVLLHGYPFDIRAFDGVVPIVNAAGFRTIVPYLRGYGPTRFLSPDTPRSGEQAALGMDLLELLDALQIQRPILAGFDWGGRAVPFTRSSLHRPVISSLTIAFLDCRTLIRRA